MVGRTCCVICHPLRGKGGTQWRATPSLVTLTARSTVNCLTTATSPAKSHLYSKSKGQYENPRPSETDFIFNSMMTSYITGFHTILSYFESAIKCREASTRVLYGHHCMPDSWMWTMNSWTELTLWMLGKLFSSTSLSDSVSHIPNWWWGFPSAHQVFHASNLKGKYLLSAREAEFIERCQECFSKHAKKTISRRCSLISPVVTQLAERGKMSHERKWIWASRE